LLIILTGPVGAGKSTTSLALAQALRNANTTVAVIDLDQMYDFVRQQDGYGDLTAWAWARRGAAALAHALFEADMSVVIVEGEFFTSEQLHTLLAPLPSDVVHHFFTLRLSYERALERVQHDPSRGVSKNPTFLRLVHNDFIQALPFLQTASIVIDADTRTLDELVIHLIAMLRAT
jgi:shikimate kinase